MWSHHSGWFGFDPNREPIFPRRSERTSQEHESILGTESNAPDDVLGEVGLVLVVVLGIVLAINAALVALHIS